MEPAELRTAFPVLADAAYLNAGTDGPVPQAAVDAAAAEVAREARAGRTAEHFARRRELADRQRAAYAEVLGCDPEEVALTSCTTEGLARVLAGLEWSDGDEVVTSDEEHPGLLGPLQVLARRRGVEVRVVPWAELADAVGPRTRMVACSHVSWMRGALAPAALAELDVPVVFDGAQGAGAVPLDVRALGCAAYACAGQKWLCGPDGTGALYVGPELRERLSPLTPGYGAFADPAAGLEAELHPDAQRHDLPALAAEASAFAVAALDVLGAFGWAAVYERATALAARLAERLRERGFTVAERDRTTLVSWEVEDPAAARERLAAAGVVVRDLPGTPYLRASVGAWSDEQDLERLLSAL